LTGPERPPPPHPPPPRLPFVSQLLITGTQFFKVSWRGTFFSLSDYFPNRLVTVYISRPQCPSPDFNVQVSHSRGDPRCTRLTSSCGLQSIPMFLLEVSFNPQHCPEENCASPPSLNACFLALTTSDVPPLHGPFVFPATLLMFEGVQEEARLFPPLYLHDH